MTSNAAKREAGYENTWLTIIAEGVQKQKEVLFQRDWDILGARREGYSVTEIAKAANLSRMHTTRILAYMTEVLEAILDLWEVEEYEVVDAVAEDLTWENFRYQLDDPWTGYPPKRYSKKGSK